MRHPLVWPFLVPSPRLRGYTVPTGSSPQTSCSSLPKATVGGTRTIGREAISQGREVWQASREYAGERAPPRLRSLQERRASSRTVAYRHPGSKVANLLCPVSGDALSILAPGALAAAVPREAIGAGALAPPFDEVSFHWEGDAVGGVRRTHSHSPTKGSSRSSTDGAARPS